MCFTPSKTVILSEARRRSIVNRGLYSAESKDPGDACWQMLLGAFRPQTTPEDKKVTNSERSCSAVEGSALDERRLDVVMSSSPSAYLGSSSAGAFRVTGKMDLVVIGSNLKSGHWVGIGFTFALGHCVGMGSTFAFGG